MTAVTIFGNGTMAQAIAGVMRAGGAEVSHIGHGETAATIQGETVFLAVPYGAVGDILEHYGEQLVGKTVVDLTNPVNFETFDDLTVAAGDSVAEEIQRAVPTAQVLKAFNTTFAATLASGKIGDATTTVLVAGNDPEAKAGLSSLITAGGLRAVDAGGLKRARELEALGFLQLTLAAGETISWSGGFALTH